ncbi:MAG: T9SS type A sorting domain-containing protein [Bacteroidota bacterium]
MDQRSTRITADTASGINILDRQQYFNSASSSASCNRSETGFSWKSGTIIANINGPIRGIRSTMGAQSGIFMQLELIFTRCRTENRFFYRIHPSIGYYEVRDFNTSAIGMMFYDDQNPNGVLIDGEDDELETTDLAEWSLTVGEPGAIAETYQYKTNIQLGTEQQFEDETVEGYTGMYHSDMGDDEPRTCTGDGASYGANGFFIQTTSCTDFKYNTTACNGDSLRHFTQWRYSYYLAPHTTTTEAIRYAKFAQSPLTVTHNDQNCATCLDGLQNGDEEDIDCGGSICAVCPTCFDGIQNQDESDVDCGGIACVPCAACNAAMIDKVANMGTYTYDNYQSISATTTISDATKITFSAADSIVLKAGFHAESGSSFHAHIQACTLAESIRDKIENRQVEASNFHFSLSPNPASQQVKISAENTDNESFNLIIYNINGQIIKRKQLMLHSENPTIDVSHLATGIYYLQLKNRTAVRVKKLIIQQ